MDKDLMQSLCVELSKQSPPIIVSHENSNKHKKYGTLKLFEQTPLPTGGGLAYTGGVLSAFDWHPTSYGICVLAAHRQDQPTHCVGDVYTGLAHLQLWKLSIEESFFLGVIPHQGDCVWDIKWRPPKQDNISNSNYQWDGLFAAALGDGSIILYEFGEFNQTENVSFEHDSNIKDLPKLRTTTIRHSTPAKYPSRIIAWSPDGVRLIAGTDDGNIEIYEQSLRKGTWYSWSLPIHSSAVVGITWVSSVHFFTLSISGHLRLHDIRSPASILEHNVDGLEGTMSLTSVEPHVVAAGCDGGTIRILRTSGIDRKMVLAPQKKAYLQTSCVRGMDSIAAGRNGAITNSIIYTTGNEGLIYEIVCPRPIWTAVNQCYAGWTHISRKMRWRVEMDKQNNPDEEIQKNEDVLEEFLHLLIGEAALKDEEDPSGAPPEGAEAAKPLSKINPSRTKKRKIAVLPYLTGREGRFVGDLYKEKVGINFVKVCKQGKIIVAGNRGGVLTWLPTELTKKGLQFASPEYLDNSKELKMETEAEIKQRLQVHRVAIGMIKESELTVASSNKKQLGKRRNVDNNDDNIVTPAKKKQKKPVVFGPKKKRGRPRKHPIAEQPEQTNEKKNGELNDKTSGTKTSGTKTSATKTSATEINKNRTEDLNTSDMIASSAEGSNHVRRSSRLRSTAKVSYGILAGNEESVSRDHSKNLSEKTYVEKPNKENNASTSSVKLRLRILPPNGSAPTPRSNNQHNESTTAEGNSSNPHNYSSNSTTLIVNNTSNEDNSKQKYNHENKMPESQSCDIPTASNMLNLQTSTISWKKSEQPSQSTKHNVKKRKASDALDDEKEVVKETKTDDISNQEEHVQNTSDKR